MTKEDRYYDKFKIVIRKSDILRAKNNLKVGSTIKIKECKFSEEHSKNIVSVEKIKILEKYPHIFRAKSLRSGLVKSYQYIELLY